MSSTFSRESAGSASGLSEPACGRSRFASGTAHVAASLPGTGRALLSCPTSKPPQQADLMPIFMSVAIPVRRGPELADVDRRAIPILPDGSLPWSAAAGPGGWSARMFLHQTLSTSRPGWTPSDTERFLSCSMLATSQLRVAGGSSLSAVLLSEPPPSGRLYLTAPMILGLFRRAVKRRRPLQRVLLRTPRGWLRRTLTVTSRAGGYDFSLPKNANLFRGSLEAGLLAWLSTLAGGLSEMQSFHSKQSSSAGRS